MTRSWLATSPPQSTNQGFSSQTRELNALLRYPVPKSITPPLANGGVTIELGLWLLVATRTHHNHCAIVCKAYAQGGVA
jgi:hypothetical protein